MATATFDPTQPFEAVTEAPAAPRFDPSKPFEVVPESAAPAPRFDPTQPFEIPTARIEPPADLSRVQSAEVPIRVGANFQELPPYHDPNATIRADTTGPIGRALRFIGQKLEPITPKETAFPRVTASDVQTGNWRALFGSNQTDEFGGKEVNPRSVWPPLPPEQINTAAKVTAGAERGLATAVGGLVPWVVAGPLIGTAARVPMAARAISAGFAADMISQLPAQAKVFTDAVRRGDVQTATEAAVGGTVNSIFSALALVHAVGPTKIPRMDAAGNPIMDPKTGEPAFDTRGIADESPLLRSLLTTKIRTEYSPDQIKEIYGRVNRGEANPAEQELVRFINSALDRPGQAVRKGVQVTKGTPLFESEFWRNYLGLKPEETSIAILGEKPGKTQKGPNATSTEQQQSQSGGQYPGTLPLQRIEAPRQAEVSPTDIGHRTASPAGQPPEGANAPVKAATPQEIAAQTGFTHDAAFEQMLPTAWHFTDRRPDSPTRGLSVAVPRTATLPEVQQTFTERAKDYTPPAPPPAPTIPPTEIKPQPQPKGGVVSEVPSQEKGQEGVQGNVIPPAVAGGQTPVAPSGRTLIMVPKSPKPLAAERQQIIRILDEMQRRRDADEGPLPSRESEDALKQRLREIEATLLSLSNPVKPGAAITQDQSNQIHVGISNAEARGANVAGIKQWLADVSSGVPERMAQQPPFDDTLRALQMAERPAPVTKPTRLPATPPTKPTGPSLVKKKATPSGISAITTTPEEVESFFSAIEPGRDWKVMSAKVSDLWNAKDVERLRKWTMHGRGFNDSTKAVVFRLLGQSVPKNIQGISDALDKWGGVTAEQRKAIEDKKSSERADQLSKDDFDAARRRANSEKVTHEGQTLGGADTVDKMIADGYTDIRNISKGAVPKYGIFKPDNTSGFGIKGAMLDYARKKLAATHTVETKPAATATPAPKPETKPAAGETKPASDAAVAAMSEDDFDAALEEASNEVKAGKKPEAPKPAPTIKIGTVTNAAGQPVKVQRPPSGSSLRKPNPAGETPKSPAENLSDAAKAMKAALDEAAKGLDELFGGGTHTGLGPTFDEKTYAKAKPHFDKAWEDTKKSGGSLKDFLMAILKRWGDVIKPYLKRWHQDLMAQTKGKTDESTTSPGSDVVGGARPPKGAVAGEAGGAPGERPAKGPSGSGRPANVGDETRPPEETQPAGGGGGGAPGVRGAAQPGVRPGQTGEVPTTGGEGAGAVPPKVAAVKPKSLDPNAENHVIQPGDEIAPKGAITKLRANISALMLLRDLEQANRNATPEEKQELARYTGWGSLSQAFDEAKARRMEQGWNRDEKWEEKWGKYYTQLKDLLSDEEWRAAARSTQYAHFTSATVIAPMWDAVRQMGFFAGKVLEPAVGVGHFFGLAPESVREDSKFIGIDQDTISARIAAKLYPQAKIFGKSFGDVAIPPNSVDLAITNVPFSARVIKDENYPLGLNLHDWYIAKMLDAVKPGGLVVTITSGHTMDSQSAMRKYLASRSELIGAIRLPNTAFKENAGTEVTTDILFLRKPMTPTPQIGEPWIDLKEIKTHDGKPVEVNEYFANHPEMIAGLPSLEGTMHAGKEEYATLPFENKPLGETLKELVAKLPKDVFERTAAQFVDFEGLGKAEGKRDRSLTVNEGALALVQGNRFVDPITISNEFRNPARVKQAVQYVGIAETYRKLIAAQNDPEATDESVEAERKKLNEVYDAYVKRFGPINGRLSDYLSFEASYYLVLGLERENITIDPTTEKASKSLVKADVFSKRTQHPTVEPQTAASLSDALPIALSFKGRLDTDYIGSLLGIKPEEAEKQLLETGAAFKNPESGLLETPDAYLSGNVRKKLAQAKSAAAEDQAYKPNVEALDKVQPEPKPFRKIRAFIGSTWIPPQLMTEFARGIFQSRYGGIQYNQASDMWIVGGFQNTPQVTQTFGTNRRDGEEILSALMNQKTLKIYDTIQEGDSERRVLNEVETQKVAARVDKLQTEFQSWLRGNEPAQKTIETAFNEAANNYVERKFEIARLDLPGASKDISFRANQRNAVWRFVQEMHGLVGHTVGAGKTMIYIATAMEARRLGLAKKPMIAVMNSTLGQFAAASRKLYPSANLLLCTQKDFEADNRKRFLARIASGDYDAIVIPHSQFNMLPDDPKFEAQMTNELLDELRTALAEATAAAGNEARKDPTVKQIEKQIEKMEGRLRELANRKTEALVTFQDLGVDLLIVDECFPYETLIDTSLGKLPIGLVVESKLPVKVLSENLATGKKEWKKIAQWHKMPLFKKLVTVTHENGQFTCTEDHKVWTQNRGYVRAALLSSRDALVHSDLSMVQGQSRGENQESILQSKLFGALAKQFAGDGRDAAEEGGVEIAIGREKVPGNQQADAIEQSDEAPRECSQDEVEADWQNFSGARGEWQSDRATKNAVFGAESSLSEYGVRHKHWASSRKVSIPTESLQGGYCNARFQTGNRSGRQNPPACEVEISGSPQNRNSQGSRVVGVEVHKRASDAGFGFGNTPSDCVYDIEVEGNHNFFAEGVLVSNCHEFKKPPFVTKRDRIAGLSVDTSKRAFSLFLKARYIQSRRQGKGVILGTGTPVTNTLGEAWHMLNIASPHILRDYKVDTFDRFLSTFTLISQEFDVNAVGKLIVRDKLSRFVNIPQLVKMIRSSWDIITQDDLRPILEAQGELYPKLKGGKVQAVVVPRTEAVKKFADFLLEVYDAYKNLTGANKREYNYIPVMTFLAGKAAALDIRLVDRTAKDEPGSKINAVVADVFKIWNSTHAVRLTDQANGKEITAPLTQAVFIDQMNPFTNGVRTLTEFASGSGVNYAQAGEESPEVADDLFLYNDIKRKLVKLGVPENQILIVNEHDTKKPEAALMFDRINRGEVRVVLGSTAKMGVGVNMQRLMYKLHHVDVPWFPALLEQRNGRIERPGNLNPEIEMSYYGMEKTADVGLYAKNESKAKWAQQILSGRVTTEESEDPMSAMILTMQEQMAQLSGDPMLFEKVQLESRIRTLKMQREAFEDDQYRKRDTKKSLTSSIASSEASIAKDTPMLAEVNKRLASILVPEGQTPVYDAKVAQMKYTVRKDVLAALDSAINQHRSFVQKKADAKEYAITSRGRYEIGHDDRSTLGTVNGLLVRSGWEAEKETIFEKDDKGNTTSRVGNKVEPSAIWFLLDNGSKDVDSMERLPSGYPTTADGALRSINEIPARIESNLEQSKAYITRSKQEIAEIDRLLEAKFAGEKELVEAEARYREIREFAATGQGPKAAKLADELFQIGDTAAPLLIRLRSALDAAEKNAAKVTEAADPTSKDDDQAILEAEARVNDINRRLAVVEKARMEGEFSGDAELLGYGLTPSTRPGIRYSRGPTVSEPLGQQAVESVVREFFGGEIPENVRFVNDPAAPRAVVEMTPGKRGQITLNLAKLDSPELVRDTLSEELIHTVWDSPSVADARRTIEGLISNVDRERQADEGYNPNETQEEAANERARRIFEDAEKANIFVRAWRAIVDAIKKLFGVKLNAEETARDAARTLMREAMKNEPTQREAVRGAEPVTPAPEEKQILESDAFKRNLELADELGKIIPEEGETGVPTKVGNVEDMVLTRPGLNAAVRQDSVDTAAAALREAGLNIVRSDDGLWSLADNASPQDMQGQALIPILERELQAARANNRPERMANLLNTVVVHLARDANQAFSQGTKDKLYALAQSERSGYGRALGGLAMWGNVMANIAQNPALNLNRIYSKAVGGPEIERVVTKLLTVFRGFFTDDEIRRALNTLNLEDTANKLIQLNQREIGSRVYRQVQNRLKAAKPKTEGQKNRRALEDEAIEALIRHAADLGHVEPPKPKGQKLTPDEQLALLSNPKVAAKVQAATEKAVQDAEFNAGWRAEQMAAKGDEEALADIEARKALGEQPSPEMIEAGFDLKEFAHWRDIRDNFLNYSPTTVKVVEDVIKSRFKGAKFGVAEPKPEDLRIDFKKLAVAPDAEVQRVFDAQVAAVEDLMRKATPETVERVTDLFRQNIAEQLARHRKETVDKMFKEQATGKETPAAIEALKKQINAGLLRDQRLSDAELAQRAADKSTVRKALPNVTDLVARIIESPRYKLADIKADVAAALMKELGLTGDQADKMAELVYRSLDGTEVAPGPLRTASRKALEQVQTSLSPADRKMLFKKGVVTVTDTRGRKQGKTLWELIERGARAGLFDATPVMENMARTIGFKVPTVEEKGRMKLWAEREIRLRTPTQREIDAEQGTPEEKLRKATWKAEKGTESTRLELIRKIQANWSRWAMPIGLRNFLDPVIRRNNAKAINEFVAANLLAKAGFFFRQGMEVGIWNVPLGAVNRSLAHVLERAQNDGGFSAATLKDLDAAAKEMVTARLSSLKATLRAAERTATGHTNRKVLDRMNHSIGLFDRMRAKADDLEAQGNLAGARALRVGTLINIGYRIAMTWDTVQAVGTEWQEMRQQLSTDLRAAGKSHGEIAATLDRIFGKIKLDMAAAMALEEAISAERGDVKSEANRQADAWGLIKAAAYDAMRAAAGTTTDYQAENEKLVEMRSWNLPVEGGPGLILAATIKGLKSETEKMGIPTGGLFSFGNAMGTATNRMFTFLGGGFVPGMFGKDSWYEGERNQRERRIEAMQGLAVMALVIALMAAGKLIIQTKYPKDKDEKEKFIASGHKVNTVRWVNDDGTWLEYPIQMAPFGFIASGLYMAGGVQQLLTDQAKAQAKLNAEAAKKGLTPGKAKAIDAGDVLGVLAQGVYGMFTGGRTASGAIQSFSDYGNFNLNRAVSGLASPYIPGLPAWQEASRVLGTAMDTRTATMLELLVPNPWSQHQRVNSLGDPMANPNDVTRLVQVMSGGIGWGNDQPSTDAYRAISAANYSTPAINPAKGYDFNGTIRPMTGKELETYTVARGQAFKQELSGVNVDGMTESEARQVVQAAYRRANASALAAVGATTSQATTRSQVSPTAQTPAGAPAAAARGGVPSVSSGFASTRGRGTLRLSRGPSILPRAPRRGSLRLGIGRGPAVRRKGSLRLPARSASLQVKRPGLRLV